MQCLKQILQHKFLFEEKTVIYLFVVTETLKIRVVHKTCHFENTPSQIYWKFYSQKKNNFR